MLSITKASNKAGFEIIFKRSSNGSLTENFMWIGQLKGVDGTGLTWKRICATSVADIPMSSLSINNTNAFSGAITYNVTNGICNLTLAGITKNLCSAYQLSTTSFPTPKNKLITIPIVNDANGEIVGMFYIDANSSSIPTCHIYKPSCRGFCSISYAVAES